MHPPFGFALFFLRSVAPRTSYVDRVPNKHMEPVETSQIYWGAVPFVIIQCIMVGLLIVFPEMVMHYKASEKNLDPAEVQRQFDNLLPAPGEGDGGLPDLPSFDLDPPKAE